MEGVGEQTSKMIEPERAQLSKGNKKMVMKF